MDHKNTILLRRNNKICLQRLLNFTVNLGFSCLTWLSSVLKIKCFHVFPVSSKMAQKNKTFFLKSSGGTLATWYNYMRHQKKLKSSLTIHQVTDQVCTSGQLKTPHYLTDHRTLHLCCINAYASQLHLLNIFYVKHQEKTKIKMNSRSLNRK